MRGEKDRIAALVPNWLGDVAMCTPALRALRRRFPDAKLTVAGKGSACGLLAGLDWIDHFEVLPERPGAWAMAGLARRLAPHARDLCVVFPHSIRAAILARFTGARQRLAYARAGRRFLLTNTVPPHKKAGRIAPRYMAFEYLDLLAPLDCADDGAGLELHADAAERAAVRELLQDGGPVVALAPGAAFGPSKCWLPERYAAVADALHEARGARCVLVTGPGEEATRDAVLKAARHPMLDANGGQPTLARLKAVLAEADLLVGNDSGPRHIAIAFDTPVICVMGSTSPKYTESPWERGAELRVDVDCGPCQKPVCATDHRCMTEVGVDTVMQAALAHLPKSD